LSDFLWGEDFAGAVFGVAVVDVYVGDVAGEFLVCVAVWGVEDEEEDVKAGEEGGGEVDVFDGGNAWVVASV